MSRLRLGRVVHRALMAVGARRATLTRVATYTTDAASGTVQSDSLLYPVTVVVQQAGQDTLIGGTMVLRGQQFYTIAARGLITAKGVPVVPTAGDLLTVAGVTVTIGPSSAVSAGDGIAVAYRVVATT